MNPAPTLPQPLDRRWFTAIAAFSGSVALLLVCTLPWHYPSSSLIYKFGNEKIFLLVGQSAGVAAGVLLIVQVILVARWHHLEKRKKKIAGSLGCYGAIAPAQM